MTYITREDGENFVIPSYRDIITIKQKSVLKNEILSLSKSYGGLITLQSKSATKYEVAFSPDRGYLLGESVWNYFKRPVDMVYCEAVPGTTEAILVIVKAESVYLDGRFPIDSIPEELVVFLTEQNNFEINIYGDVPISQTPEDGKFSFDAASVKSFTILENPIFPIVPLYKPYRFEQVNEVLKSHGIGVFPVKQLLVVIAIIAVGWMLWSNFMAPAEVVEAPPPPPPQANPYQGFYDALATPAPNELINLFLKELNILLTMPGWTIKDLNFSNGTLRANVQSPGSKLQDLYTWASANNATVNIKRDGIGVSLTLPIESRPQAANIYPLKRMLAKLIDDLATIYPGNHLQLGEFTNRGDYYDMSVVITLENASPTLLMMISQRLKDYPMSLRNIVVTFNNGGLNGAINLLLLGS